DYYCCSYAGRYMPLF
nr:immunoglobulin light chain junction region [Macaca mulatta]